MRLFLMGDLLFLFVHAFDMHRARFYHVRAYTHRWPLESEWRRGWLGFSHLQLLPKIFEVPA